MPNELCMSTFVPKTKQNTKLSNIARTFTTVYKKL